MNSHDKKNPNKINFFLHKHWIFTVRNGAQKCVEINKRNETRVDRGEPSMVSRAHNYFRYWPRIREVTVERRTQNVNVKFKAVVWINSAPGSKLYVCSKSVKIYCVYFNNIHIPSVRIRRWKSVGEESSLQFLSFCAPLLFYILKRSKDGFPFNLHYYINL